MTSKPNKQKQKFPSRITNMIRAAHTKGWNATKTATHINNSITAKTNNVSYSVQQIAAKLAHITMGR